MNVCIWWVYYFPGIDSFSFGFTFPAYNASTKITIHGFIECLIHHRGIPHSIASDQETHSRAKEVWHWYYYGSYQFEAAGLIKQWNGPLNAQLQHQLGGNSLTDWRTLCRKLYMFSHGQRSRVRNEWRKWKCCLSLLPQILLLVLTTLCRETLFGMFPLGDTAMIPLTAAWWVWGTYDPLL